MGRAGKEALFPFEYMCPPIYTNLPQGPTCLKFSSFTLILDCTDKSTLFASRTACRTHCGSPSKSERIIPFYAILVFHVKFSHNLTALDSQQPVVGSSY